MGCANFSTELQTVSGCVIEVNTIKERNQVLRLEQNRMYNPKQ